LEIGIINTYDDNMLLTSLFCSVQCNILVK